MRNYRSRDGKQVARNVPKNDDPKIRHFYALCSRGAKSNEGEYDDGKYYIS